MPGKAHVPTAPDLTAQQQMLEEATGAGRGTWVVDPLALEHALLVSADHQADRKRCWSRCKAFCQFLNSPFVITCLCMKICNSSAPECRELLQHRRGAWGL